MSGCLGDCCRAEGDAEGTQGHYERSMELLQAAGEDPEASDNSREVVGRVVFGLVRGRDWGVGGEKDQAAGGWEGSRGERAGVGVRWEGPRCCR